MNVYSVNRCTSASELQNNHICSSTDYSSLRKDMNINMDSNLVTQNQEYTENIEKNEKIGIKKRNSSSKSKAKTDITKTRDVNVYSVNRCTGASELQNSHICSSTDYSSVRRDIKKKKLEMKTVLIYDTEEEKLEQDVMYIENIVYNNYLNKYQTLMDLMEQLDSVV